MYLYSYDDERAILYHIFVSNELYLLEKVKPSYFYSQIHQRLFNHIKHIVQSEHHFDHYKLINSFDLSTRKEISDLLDVISEKSMYYSESDVALKNLKRYYIKRELKHLSYDTMYTINKEEEVERVLSNMLNRIHNLTCITHTEQNYLNNVSDIISSGQKNQIIQTNLKALDNLIGGFEKGELIVLGARSSIGKTTFMCNMVSRFLQNQLKVMVVSFETAAEHIVCKLLCLEYGLSFSMIRDGSIDSIMKEKLMHRVKNLDSNTFKIIDHLNSQDALRNIRVLVASMKQKQGLDILCVDYLQMMKLPNKDSLHLEVLEIVRELKNISMESNIATILLSQVSRAVDVRETVPKLSELSFSSAIENHSDKVLFLHRQDYYNKYHPDKVTDLENCFCEVHVAKNRYGQTGSCKFMFDLYSGRITDI